VNNSSKLTPDDSGPSSPAAGLVPRLMAMVYDSLLLIALFAAVSLPVVLWMGERSINENLAVLLLYRLLLLLTAFLFFGWFWTHGGQTLGMRAWRLRTVKYDHSPMDWASAGRRFAASLVSFASAGLGYLWILVDPERLAWHDRLSATRVERLPKKSSES
jgi:uncharacterized RDD family membrane protein YckC